MLHLNPLTENKIETNYTVWRGEGGPTKDGEASQNFIVVFHSWRIIIVHRWTHLKKSTSGYKVGQICCLAQNKSLFFA